MSHLFAALWSLLIATGPAEAPRNLVPKSAGVSIQVPDANDPAEKEYLKLLLEDDAAQAEADKWIREANAFEAQGAGFPRATLTARIEQRFEPVRKAYEDFLLRHPDHVRARLAYGSFLNDIHDEEGAVAQWEKARQTDPKNPAAWNNLANHYGHSGPIEKAFEYYEKAIELNPNEPVYLQNLGTTTYLFRKDAMERYKITEQEVFDRALELYGKAMKLDTNNFLMAHDLAQTYYGIRPLRAEDALAAWNDALKLAGDQIEREGVYLHMARVELNSGRFEDARQHLNSVTNQMYTVLKNRLTRNLTEKEAKARSAETPPATRPEPK